MKHRTIEKPVILFDGVCNLCNSSVNFIIDHDTHAQFCFASLQSEPGQKLLAKYNRLGQSLDSICLIEDDTCFIQSDAIVRIAYRLKGFKWAGILLRFVPRFIREPAYKWVA